MLLHPLEVLKVLKLIRLREKDFRVTFIISINVDELRKKLEFDKIIQSLALAADTGGIKPSIMIFPSDVWMKENKYYTEVDNQGVKQFVLTMQLLF